MVERISFCQFCDRFREMGRVNQFSYKGQKALYDYLENLADETGEEIELDVIGLCGEFTEYEDLEDFQNDYGEDYQSIEDIEYNTTVIPLENSDGFIISDF